MHYKDEKKSLSMKQIICPGVRQMLETKLLLLCGKTKLCSSEIGDKDEAGKTMGGNRISHNEVGLGLMRLAHCPYQIQTTESACVFDSAHCGPLHTGLARGPGGCTGLPWCT